MAQALVPLKDLVQAKSRLSGLLRPSERRALAQAMVEDVLAVLSTHEDIERVTLVSDDPCAELLAGKYGIDCWTERSLACRGLNAVVRQASERLLADYGGVLVVLHGDLPLLTSADISAVLDAQSSLDGLVVGCDRQGTGTNLLAFTGACVPQFCFGIDSCSRHLASARRAGMPAKIMQRSGIAVDVDEPGDMAVIIAALEQEQAGQTFHLLHDTGLGARVELALASLIDASNSGRGDNKGKVN